MAAVISLPARPISPNAPEPDAAISADLELVRRAQGHDSEALESLCAGYYPRVYNFCLSQVRDAAAAEDLAADVMLKMVESLHAYRPSGVPFSAWVFRIARNKLIDLHRYSRRRRRVPLTDLLLTAKAGPELAVETAHEHRALYRALSELRPSERDVIILRFLAGLDTRTVAALIDRTESATKSLQHRGLKALRRRLAPARSAA